MAEQEKNSLLKAVRAMDEFKKCLKDAEDKLVVVDFYADWCGPCKMMGPKVEELSKERADKVVFLKVNVDDCDDVAENYGIQAMPTFKFFRNGKEVGGVTGANYTKLKESIESEMEK